MFSVWYSVPELIASNALVQSIDSSVSEEVLTVGSAADSAVGLTVGSGDVVSSGVTVGSGDTVSVAVVDSGVGAVVAGVSSALTDEQTIMNASTEAVNCVILFFPLIFFPSKIESGAKRPKKKHKK